MAVILAPLLKEGWLRNDLDDVILWGPGVPLERVKRLLTLPTKNRIKLNLSKCTFGLKEVNFLRQIISEDGNKPDPKNFEAVMNLKPPATVKEVRRFLGMVGFYRKHIPSFANVGSPLTNLTRADVTFAWTPHSKNAFEHLRMHS